MVCSNIDSRRHADDDADITQRLLNGDESAIGDLMDKYRDRVYACAFELLRNRQDAEEIAQDAFIRVQRNIRSFRGECALSTWLFQIVRNLSYNRYWYWVRRRREESLSIDMNLTDQGQLSLADMLPGDEDTPAQSLAKREFEESIEACMPRLNKRHREILELRLNGGRSYESIAGTLRISVGTVKSRIARARDNLRQELGVHFELARKAS